MLPWRSAFLTTIAFEKENMEEEVSGFMVNGFTYKCHYKLYIFFIYIILSYFVVILTSLGQHLLYLFVSDFCIIQCCFYCTFNTAII